MNQHQRIGLHVSAAGGVENAPDNAKEVDAECFQFFSRSPRGGAAATISVDQVKLFKQKCNRNDFESYIHTPYYINFGSPKKSLSRAAPRIVREELERGSQLGVKYVMTHLGSAKDWSGAATGRTPTAALKQTIAGLKDIFATKKKLSTQLLLEISAGAGAVIGDSFEELGYILRGLGRKDVHICLDTCHLFASGYDIRDAKTIEVTMKAFRQHIGIAHLKLVHMNDSKGDFNNHKDRHEHIGKGKIGVSGFKALLAHKDFQKVNFILETKHDQQLAQDLAFLKKHRVQL